jgi:hypothetical protein
MSNIKYQFAKLTTTNNIRLITLLLSLVALAVAAGAPGAESGLGGR